MENNRKTEIKQKSPDNLVIYDPDKPLYEKQFLCIYLSELIEEAQKEAAKNIDTEKQQKQEDIK